MEDLLSQEEAARRLKISQRTLERQRVSGDGPPFVKLGRCVRYRLSDLAGYVESRVRTSTSESAP